MSTCGSFFSTKSQNSVKELAAMALLLVNASEERMFDSAVILKDVGVSSAAMVEYVGASSVAMSGDDGDVQKS